MTSYLFFQKSAPRHVILSAAGAKDPLLMPEAKQVLRYARVPRASLRMTGSLALVRKEKEKKAGGEATVVRSLAEPHTPGLLLLARGTRQRLVQVGPARPEPAPAG